jgi:hypothetical protein
VETKGILKVDVTVGGVTHKAGTEASFPAQYGLEACFESSPAPKPVKNETPKDGGESE